MLRYTLILAMLAVWAVAIQAWPGLPERIPLHFDAGGQPDGWVAKGWVVWFALPVLASLLGGVVGLALPAWTERLAERNSPYLNVPDRRRFAALSAAARVRALQPMRRGLALVGLCVQGLFGWIVYGCTQVASNAWQTLSPMPVFAFVAAILLAALGMTLGCRRAIRREFATNDR